MEKLIPKERIRLAATHLFARQGFGVTGLRDLAAQAEVNLAMINYFFGSKKGLLKEILDSFFSGYLSIARKELVGTESFHTKLSRFIYRSVCYFEEEQDLLLVWITELPHDDQDIVEYKANWARQMAAILKTEVCVPLTQETGRNIPPTCIGPILTSLMASRFLFAPVMKQVSEGHDTIIDTHLYTKMITKIFLQGITDPDWKLDSE